jgi:alpha-tubulin suppressor-like RCC1 family protein
MRAWWLLTLSVVGCGTSEFGGKCASDPAACEDSSTNDAQGDTTNGETLTDAETEIGDTVVDISEDTAQPESSAVDSAATETLIGDSSSFDTGSVADTAVVDSVADVIVDTSSDSALDTAACTPSTKTCEGKVLRECDAMGKASSTTCGVRCAFGACVEVSELAAGMNHVCALLTDSTVQCWGQNSFGQLGNGTTTNFGKPSAVKSLSGAAQVAAGGSGTCARSSDLTLRCWGSDEEGELGDGDGVSESSTPVLLPGKYLHVSVGFSRACAIRDDDRLVCWGLHPGDSSDGAFAPTEITSMASVSRIVVGGPAFALSKGATAWKSWGENTFGQLASGTTSTLPVLAPNGTVAVGTYFAVAFENGCAGTGGALKCWGRNQFGEVGDDSTAMRTAPVTVAISNVQSVAATWSHVCAVLGDASLKCWGSNANGEVGDGTKAERHVPTPITAVTGVRQVVVGNAFTCALLNDRSVRCWGRNASGQLGDDTFVDSTTPVTVKW